ncbi:serine/threonine-protein phosphatase 7 long form homolog [Daucus carota subsp. sativus]|uniref:serine/threonine-protein phosphatase 7 long form homolog n=1 Tax=Daucus carota subsp. sativus TaxID=79200 RepID=UPI0030834A77
MDPVVHHPGPIDDSLLTLQTDHRSEAVWNMREPPEDLVVRVNFGDYWNTVKNHRPHVSIVAAITAAGFGWIFRLGKVRHDRGVITAFIERWRPETHTFHFSFGEATITLEDVHHILGLQTTGRPLILHGHTSTAAQKVALVRDLLGLAPDTADLKKDNLKIRWLITHFGRCHRLDESAEDFGAQSIFHIRAHLLCVIGSLFPHASGNSVPLSLLRLLDDLESLGGYSWGSAVLSYTYRKMCDASRGVKDFTGYATLLQVWIYERFPTIAPHLRSQPQYTYPLALRWVASVTRTQVPDAQSRMTWYELDNMGVEQFLWWPYAYLDDEFHPEQTLYLQWTAPTPLMYMAYVEWCYTDRVTRQFGFVQDIPTSSPRRNHHELHDVVNESIDWQGAREIYIHYWDTSLARAMTSPPFILGNGCSPAYMPWYLQVTRRYMVNPLFWRKADAFQGTQGATQSLEEQILEVDSAIDPAAPDLNRAQSLLQGMIARVRGHGGPPTRRGRRPVTPVEPEPGTYYTHVGSSSWSHHVGTSTAPDRDARAPSGAGEWPRWTEVATETAGDDYVGGDGGFAVNLGADEDTSPSGGHTHVSPPLQESYQFADRDVYRPDMSFLTDQYTTPPLQAPVPSFGSPSYVFGAPAFPVTPAGVRSTPTPVHMHSFGAYAGESSPWAVQDQSEPEGPSQPEQRQQPPRDAKGKGMRCHTGSHIFGHKK